MLTWAMVFLTVKAGEKWGTAFPYLAAMGCDVGIFYWISEAFNHACK